MKLIKYHTFIYPFKEFLDCLRHFKKSPINISEKTKKAENRR